MAGKGARQAKGSRGGKGSSQKTKVAPLKTVKAADLVELSSDDDGGEQDTVSLLQSLLGGGSGTSGRVLDRCAVQPWGLLQEWHRGGQG